MADHARALEDAALLRAGEAPPCFTLRRDSTINLARAYLEHDARVRELELALRDMVEIACARRARALLARSRSV